MSVEAPVAAQLVEVAGRRWWIRDQGDLSSLYEVADRQAYFTRRLRPEPGERWVDGGANVGAFAVTAAAAGADVIAYEPWPESAALARRNLRENELRARVLEKAIALHGGIARLGLARGAQWRHSLRREGGEGFPVPVVAFADAIDRADGCKLDIEGAEVEILQQAGFGSLRKLVLEWHFDWEPATNVYLAVLDRLREHFDEVSGRKVPPDTDYRWFPPAGIVRCQR